MKIFDAHFHIINYDFEINENNGYLPPNYTVNDYTKEVEDLGIIRGAIVSGSFQGYNQQYLMDALEKLGTQFVGVTQLPFTVTDDEILKLHQHGVRVVRFNIKRGNSINLKELKYFAERVYHLVGWHSEIYIDAKNLSDILSEIKGLPAVSIDHLGLSKEGLPTLLELVSNGIKVKATGFSRGNLNIIDTLDSLYKANPKALMFGTDLPSTRAPERFSIKDVNLITQHFSKEICEDIFYNNAAEWYYK